jgi:hypothetical protein
MMLPLLWAAIARGQDDLPRHAPGDGMDFEPKLMLEGTGALLLGASPTRLPEDRVEQCKAALVQAEQRAADSEQLFKEGVLAKVEVEACFLRIVQRKKELADAMVEVAQGRVDATAKAFSARGATQADLDATNADLKADQTAAGAASAAWDKAQLDAAVLDLQRKQKLYSEGVGSKHEVQVAEDRVALLSGGGRFEIRNQKSEGEESNIAPATVATPDPR